MGTHNFIILSNPPDDKYPASDLHKSSLHRAPHEPCKRMDDLQHSQGLYPRSHLAYPRISRARALEERDEERGKARLDLGWEGRARGEEGARFEVGDEGEVVREGG